MKSGDTIAVRFKGRWYPGRVKYLYTCQYNGKRDIVVRCESELECIVFQLSDVRPITPREEFILKLKGSDTEDVLGRYRYIASEENEDR